MSALPSEPDPGITELDAMVDEFNALQSKCREVRLELCALVERYRIYSDKLAAAEAAQEKSA